MTFWHNKKKKPQHLEKKTLRHNLNCLSSGHEHLNLFARSNKLCGVELHIH